MFTEANALKRAQSPPPSTTLTAFFDLCTTDNFAKTLKYPELPEYYTWNKSTKQCQRRKRGELVDGEYQGDDIRKLYAIRMYTVSPRAENATICIFYLMKYPARFFSGSQNNQLQHLRHIPGILSGQRTPGKWSTSQPSRWRRPLSPSLLPT